MAEIINDRMHTLIIPIHGGAVMVPSVMTAEIIALPALIEMPFAEPWLLGVGKWRGRAVPVVSYEVMIGLRTEPFVHGRTKLVVFHPVTRRNDWDFIGILATAEPQPYTVSSALDLVSDDENADSAYIGARIKLHSQQVIIPNIDAMRESFYPVA